MTVREKTATGSPWNHRRRATFRGNCELIMAGCEDFSEEAATLAVTSAVDTISYGKRSNKQYEQLGIWLAVYMNTTTWSSSNHLAVFQFRGSPLFKCSTWAFPQMDMWNKSNGFGERSNPKSERIDNNISSNVSTIHENQTSQRNIRTNWAKPITTPKNGCCITITSEAYCIIIQNKLIKGYNELC